MNPDASHGDPWRRPERRPRWWRSRPTCASTTCAPAASWRHSQAAPFTSDAFPRPHGLPRCAGRGEPRGSSRPPPASLWMFSARAATSRPLRSLVGLPRAELRIGASLVDGDWDRVRRTRARATLARCMKNSPLIPLPDLRPGCRTSPSCQQSGRSTRHPLRAWPRSTPHLLITRESTPTEIGPFVIPEPRHGFPASSTRAPEQDPYHLTHLRELMVALKDLPSWHTSRPPCGSRLLRDSASEYSTPSLCQIRHSQRGRRRRHRRTRGDRCPQIVCSIGSVAC